MRGFLDWMMRKRAQACPVAQTAQRANANCQLVMNPYRLGFRPKRLLLHHCLVHQQDRYVVAHRIHPTTLGTFQALAVFFLQQRLLANWANQYFEKIGGNHARILPQVGRRREAATKDE